jgi:hypothetical protein
MYMDERFTSARPMLQPPRLVLLLHALLFLILFTAPLRAQFMVQNVSLAYLVQRADVIVQGRVTNVSHDHLPGYPNIPTVTVTLNVENMLRGPATGTYTFREVFLGLRGKEGKQSYSVGHRILLFLPTPSPFGLSSPVGIEQGRFHVGAESASGAKVFNEIGNYGLFKDVENSANKAGIQLTKKQLQVAATANGPVPLDDFLSLVKSLTSLPRIR